MEPSRPAAFPAWGAFELESHREDLVSQQSGAGGMLLLGALTLWVFRAMVTPGFAFHTAFTVLAPLLTITGIILVAVNYFRRPNPTTTPFLDMARTRAADVVWVYATRFERRTKSGPRVSERVTACLSDGSGVTSNALPEGIAESVLRSFPGALVGDTVANRASYQARIKR